MSLLWRQFDLHVWPVLDDMFSTSVGRAKCYFCNLWELSGGGVRQRWGGGGGVSGEGAAALSGGGVCGTISRAKN